MLCKMWSCGGIDKSCFFLMSASSSGLGSFEDTIKSNYFSNKFPLYKHGLSILENSPVDGRSSVCMDTLVHLES